MGNTRGKATAYLLIMQAIFILLFGLFVDYGDQVGPEVDENSNSTALEIESQLDRFYPMFQDVHVMMLIGFGFLMTFLKRHGYGSIGFNFLLTCFVIEWSILVNGFFEMIVNGRSDIAINIESLLNADFAVATVLISFGAILGVASPLQLAIMATVEVLFYNLNILIGFHILGAIDVGGSIFIHAFGAYFGLAVARMLYNDKQKEHKKEGSNYHSDLFAMIGTLFLWLYWPSFNAGPAEGNERHRAVINTILSLSACTVCTFALSAFVNKKGKLNMVHIQNATLAGGVAMGASADLLVRPFGALLIGSTAAAVSVLGYRFLQDLLLEKAKVHDTCGVHYLHGMPGVLGAIASAIAIAAANEEVYQKSFSNLFDLEGPLRIGINQAGAQVAAVVVALALAVVTGLFTGFIVKQPCWDNLSGPELFEDEIFWEMDDDGAKGMHAVGKEDTQSELEERKSLTKQQDVES